MDSRIFQVADADTGSIWGDKISQYDLPEVGIIFFDKKSCAVVIRFEYIAEEPQLLVGFDDVEISYGSTSFRIHSISTTYQKDLNDYSFWKKIENAVRSVDAKNGQPIIAERLKFIRWVLDKKAKSKLQELMTRVL